MNQQKTIHLDICGSIGVIVFDDPTAKVNTLNSRLTSEFEEVLNTIEKDSKIKAAVLISGKSDCFIAGADIAQLQSAQSVKEAQTLSEGGQKLLNRLADSKKPIIAAINGSCLGGGLEVALACHYRIATNNPKTMLALPEVMLGLLPGAGGTQRLPRLVGIQGALDMMLTGKNIRPQKAKKMGLVDVVTVPQGLREVAIQAAERLVSGELKRKRRKRVLMEKLLEGNPAGRSVLFSQARKMVMKQSGGLYPAPLAILDVVKQTVNQKIEKGLQLEAQKFGELSQTPESKSLITIFFGQTALKKNRFGKPNRPAKTLAVLGAGLMGAGISSVSAQKGFNVLLKDINMEAACKGQKQLGDDLSKKVKRKALSTMERDTIMGRVTPLADYRGFDHADMVIEAVFEDIKLKHRVLKEVEEQIPEHCIFASNTSALPIKDIAQASRRPQNVVGMHYFSPVQKMPLLEIIVTEQTCQEARASAVDVGLRQGKTVIVVNDGPGFYTTRILAPFMDEAILLAQEGVDFYLLDSALKKFGYPVGPVTLMDEVGIDVGVHVAESLGKAFGERMSSADPKVMEQMISNKFLGRKSGQGFFLYNKKGKGKKPINPGVKALFSQNGTSSRSRSSIKLEDIQHRIALRMVNEAAYCLQEGILENPVDGDIGAIFGLGFPPFRGGPFRYVDAEGAQNILDRLNRYADQLGKRFTPAPSLVDMAKGQKKFHTSSRT